MSHVQELHYVQVQPSTTGRPAPALPIEPVLYSTVKEAQTDNTVTKKTDINTEVC